MPRITSLLCTSSEMQRGCYWLLGLWALLACAAAVGRSQTPACTHRTVDPRTGAPLVFANLGWIAYASRRARGTHAKGQWESREPVGVDEAERESGQARGERDMVAWECRGDSRCARLRTRRRSPTWTCACAHPHTARRRSRTPCSCYRSSMSFSCGPDVVLTSMALAPRRPANASEDIEVQDALDNDFVISFRICEPLRNPSKCPVRGGQTEGQLARAPCPASLTLVSLRPARLTSRLSPDSRPARIASRPNRVLRRPACATRSTSRVLPQTPRRASSMSALATATPLVWRAP